MKEKNWNVNSRSIEYRHDHNTNFVYYESRASVDIIQSQKHTNNACVARKTQLNKFQLG